MWSAIAGLSGWDRERLRLRKGKKWCVTAACHWSPPLDARPKFAVRASGSAEVQRSRAVERRSGGVRSCAYACTYINTIWTSNVRGKKFACDLQNWSRWKEEEKSNWSTSLRQEEKERVSYSRSPFTDIETVARLEPFITNYLTKPILRRHFRLAREIAILRRPSWCLKKLIAVTQRAVHTQPHLHADSVGTHAPGRTKQLFGAHLHSDLFSKAMDGRARGPITRAGETKPRSRAQTKEALRCDAQTKTSNPSKFINEDAAGGGRPDDRREMHEHIFFM